MSCRQRDLRRFQKWRYRYRHHAPRAVTGARGSRGPFRLHRRGTHRIRQRLGKTMRSGRNHVDESRFAKPRDLSHMASRKLRRLSTIFEPPSTTSFCSRTGRAAFSSVIAKKAGLAFSSTILAIVAHGPTAWLLDANRTLAREPQTLAQLHMERVAFELADAVVSPSRYMLKWLRENGQLTPESQATAIPLYLWSDLDEDQRPRPGVCAGAGYHFRVFRSPRNPQGREPIPGCHPVGAARIPDVRRRVRR